MTISNGIQHWMVPADGDYRISVHGGQGGSINGYYGGDGAIMIGDFSLSEGDVLQIMEILETGA